ncbi:TPA: hypothetical protein QDA93_002387 [Burkholderia vietnamiensis]|nr:hypothetical protein [Burkholderia vietnamiensis]
MTTTDNSRADAQFLSATDAEYVRRFRQRDYACIIEWQEIAAVVRYICSLETRSSVEQPAAAPTHSPECEYIKTDNPWAACTCGIGSPNNPAPSPADERAANPWEGSCPVCHGNDADAPCAYPGERKHGCIRDERIARAASANETGAEGAFIDIVFDGPPSRESGRFVEVEDEHGRSFNAGDWIDRGNGLWALRIVRSPAMAAEAPEELPHWFEMFLTNVCELPDRNSPEGEPDAIVATLDELRNCALNAIEQCVSYAAPQPAQADARVGLTFGTRLKQRVTIGSTVFEKGVEVKYVLEALGR